MSIASLLRGVSAAQRARLAADIARRSEDAVWDCVGNQMASMSLPEARGYIRARAASTLQIEGQRVLSRASTGRVGQRSEVMELATQTLVHAIVARLLREERQHAYRRAA